jgi:phage gp29-like protein
MSLVDRFLSLFGINRAPAPVLGDVVPNLPLSLQHMRIGGAMTPQQVSEIYRQADIGYMWQLQDLAHESRQKDGHLQSILGTRENAIKGLRWQIVCEVGARQKDQRAADWLTQVLRQSSNFPDMLAHLVGGNYHGYAVSEIHFREVEKRRLAPVSFKAIAPRRLVFEQKEGKLRQCDVYGGSRPYPGIDLQEEYPGKFVVFQPRVNGDVPVREGLARVLIWSALFRNWSLRDWLALGELAWKPWRIGTYKKSADPISISNLREQLRHMSATGAMVKPEDVTIEVNWPKNNGVGPTHKELSEFLGSEMSKAVLGQTLTTEAGSRGARSLGEVHDKVRRDILEADAVAIAGCLTRDLIAPLVAMNFGDSVDVPQFVFVTEDGVVLKDFSAAILNLQKAGLKIKAADVRDIAGLSEPGPDDEILDPAPQPAPALANGDKVSAEEDKDEGAEEDKDDDDDAEDAAA